MRFPRFSSVCIGISTGNSECGLSVWVSNPILKFRHTPAEGQHSGTRPFCTCSPFLSHSPRRRTRGEPESKQYHASPASVAESHPEPGDLVYFKGSETINTKTSKSEEGWWGGVKTLYWKAKIPE